VEKIANGILSIEIETKKINKRLKLDKNVTRIG